MEQKFKTGDWVSMRVATPEGNIWPWFRVEFIDSDDTFIAVLVKYPEGKGFESYKDPIKLKNENVHQVLKKGNLPKGKQFSYSDNITICDCPGVCRNK